MLRNYARLPYSKPRNPVTPSRQNQNFQSDTLIDLAYTGTMLWGNKYMIPWKSTLPATMKEGLMCTQTGPCCNDACY